MNITINRAYTPNDLHHAVYNGDFVVQTNIQAVEQLLHHTRKLITAAFGDTDPETAQYSMPVEDFIPIIAKLKSTFTNHETIKGLIKKIIEELSYDLSDTYFDVPRLRIVTSDDYLSSGVGYAYKAHRDTWYGSPEQQVNVWLPVYDTTSQNGLLFYPHYWEHSIENNSEYFDYDEWVNAGRKLAVSQVKTDTRNHPLTLSSPAATLPFVYSGKAGSTLFFSASHLHGTLPNQSGKTRFSIDFRLIRREDLSKQSGAANLDNKSKGTTLGDFLNAADLTKLDSEIIDQFRK